MVLNDRWNDKANIPIEPALPLEGAVDFLEKIAFRLVPHARALEHNNIVGLLLDDVRNKQRPVIAAAEILLVQPDGNATFGELFGQRFGVGLVPVFMAEKRNGSIVRNSQRNSTTSRKSSSLRLKVPAQLPSKIKPREILKFDAMTFSKEKSRLRLLRIPKET